MAKTNQVNIQTANFSVAGNWEFTGSSVKLNNIPSATTSDIVYYDSTTKALSYGVAPSGGGGVVSTKVTSFAANGSGTFNVDPKTLFLQIECWGAGGGGGACSIVGPQGTIGGSGGGGGYAKKLYNSFPSSFTYTVGQGGAGGIGGPSFVASPGSPGGTTLTSLGISASGGGGGSGSPFSIEIVNGGSGGIGSGGDITIQGQTGAYSQVVGVSRGIMGASGAASGFYGLPSIVIDNVNTNGASGGPTAGGRGGAVFGGFQNGGNGGDGVIVVTEYLSA